MFHLYVEQGNDLDVFQRVRFRLQDENRDYFKMAATNPYDSVVWKLAGTNHSLRFTQGNYYNTMEGGFEYLFTKTGNYKSFLQWYHSGEFIGADTINITVSDKSPFLGHDFKKEFTENIEDPFDSNVGYVFLNTKSNAAPYMGQGLVNILQMGVYFKESPIKMDDSYFQQQRRFYINYFTHTYGTPTYTKEKDDIDAMFYQYFGLDNEQYQYLLADTYQSMHPEQIWISPTSYIALVRIHFTSEDWVIANWDPSGYPYPVHDEFIIWAKER